MINLRTSLAALALTIPLSPLNAEDLKVKITADLATVTVQHNGKPVTIQRNQDGKKLVWQDLKKVVEKLATA